MTPVDNVLDPRARRGGAPWSVISLRVIALAAIALVIFVRVRLLNTPLERDEGEYAYTAQLILQGIPPFQLASNMKLPGTDLAYALILLLFGQTPVGIHVGLLLVNLGAIIAMFFLGRRLFGNSAGWTGAAVYAVLAVGMKVLGTSAHATHFVVLIALAACLLLMRWQQSQRLATLFGSGLLFGTALLMKQPGAIFVFFGVAYLLWNGRHKAPMRVARDVAVLALGGALPLTITCLFFWRIGVFPKFWFWTFTYARAYGSMTHFSLRVISTLYYTVRGLAWSNWPLWLLAASGGVLLACNRHHRKSAIWMGLFLFFSFLAVCPGLIFRPHYFVLLLPAIALLADAGVALAGEYVPRPLLACIVAIAFAVCAVQSRQLFFQLGETQASLELYRFYPFPESRVIADYINTHSMPDARVAVFGSEPEIYFYSHRHSATDFVYTYALMEPQPYNRQMQNAFIRDLETVKPEYIVEVHIRNSWLDVPESPRHIFDWFAGYWPRYYDPVGIADVISPTNIVHRWDNAAAEYRPESDDFIRVLRRR